MQIRKEQILIDKVKPDLPISIYPEREILAKLREHFEDATITKSTLFEIHEMTYMGDEGGIVCEIRTPTMNTEEAKAVFLCSITHFRIKRGEPYYSELEKYRLKRIRRLARQNRRRPF